jgi:DNA replication protein DnaC
MQKISNFLKDPKNFLVIIGEPGTSKTHFCSALAEWILTTFNSHRYWLEEKLHERLQEGFDSNEGSPKTLKYLIDDHLIILDDVGSNGWSTWKEKVFFNFIDSRYNSTMPTIITSNLTRSEFYNTYEPRTCSRLFAKENLIIELNDVRNYRNT